MLMNLSFSPDEIDAQQIQAFFPQLTGKLDLKRHFLPVAKNLVHDDIMDNASQRRGVPTAYAKWGAELSVFLGDCMFCQALKICANFPETDYSKKIADASIEVCSGEILQTQRRFDLKLTIPEYFKSIEMKTGALFRISTELAAQLSNVTAEQVQAARVFGNSLGIAYQVYDDCLDLV